MMRDPLTIARSIGDRFVSWQGIVGRPDPAKCPFVTTGRSFGPTHAHSPPYLAQALYRLYERTNDARYKEAADRYAVFSFSFVRDPVPPVADRQRNLRLSQRMERDPSSVGDPRTVNNLFSRSWMQGVGLWCYGEFCLHNPDEDCFDARADSLFDYLQQHRTDRGHAYNIGYPPSNCQDPSITDGAFTDDLRWVGMGLVHYYEQTRRDDVLASAVRLADYYLRLHEPGSPDGAFVDSLGTWCIGPWPTDIAAEHFPSVRMDETGWGFSARGAVEFLTRLHTWLPAQHPREAVMRDRCTRSVEWQFSCQFPDGAVGMHTQDDHWLGMTAAALLAYDHIRAVGWVDAALEERVGPKAAKAKQWLLTNATEELIDQGGYRKITGRTTPHPPENLAWLLGWTVEALLRLEAEEH